MSIKIKKTIQIGLRLGVLNSMSASGKRAEASKYRIIRLNSSHRNPKPCEALV
jgi:hypothetical protein